MPETIWIEWSRRAGPPLRHRRQRFMLVGDVIQQLRHIAARFVEGATCPVIGVMGFVGKRSDCREFVVFVLTGGTAMARTLICAANDGRSFSNIFGSVLKAFHTCLWLLAL